MKYGDKCEDEGNVHFTLCMRAAEFKGRENPLPRLDLNHTRQNEMTHSHNGSFMLLLSKSFFLFQLC